MKKQNKQKITEEQVEAVRLLLMSVKTNYQIAKETGITETSIGNYRNKKTTPTLPNAKLIISKLTSNDDNTLKDRAESTHHTHYVSKLRMDRLIKAQQVNLYSLEAAAGLVQLFSSPGDHEPIGVMSIPDLPKCDGALFVRGDSMHPLLKSGDIIAYKQVNNISTGIFIGEMYILDLDIDGDWYTTIKYVHKAGSPDHVRLISHNPDHAPREVHISCIRAAALVKASVRFNTIT